MAWVVCAIGVTDASAVARFVPDDFATIQAAIDASAAGDVVTVEPGTYTGNLALKSGVDVRGREAARTLLRPEDVTTAVVTADSVDLVTFGNFTVIDAQVGIDIIGSSNLQIVNTVLDSAAEVGIRADNGSDASLLNNVFYSNAIAVSRGVAAVTMTNNAFVGNTVTITSPSGLLDPNAGVDSCGFFDNADLESGGVDTPLGTNAVVGEPRFVSTAQRDFHLRGGSAFIDAGLGTDVIDQSVADIGAYGGAFADARPFPLAAPSVTDVSDPATPGFAAALSWDANPAYRVTNSANPGSYRAYYRQNDAGPPYEGTDAGNGTLPSPVQAGAATALTLDELQPQAPPPAAPQLVDAASLDGAVKLSWNAVANAAAYRVYWGETATGEQQADVGDVTSYAVTGLVDGVTYRFAVAALRQPVYHFSVTALDNTPVQHESDYSAESTLALGPQSEGAVSNTLTARPAVTTPYPDLPDEGCFVATAAWGADWQAEVLALRDFRDRVLLPTHAGRAFVRIYYHYGPAAADYIRDSAVLRQLVRVLLWPLVALALLALNLTAIPAAVCAILIAGFAGMRMTGIRANRRHARGEV